MNEGMNERDARDPAMKPVETREGPSRQPNEGIVSCGKDPDDRDVGKRELSGAVRDIPAKLFVLGRPTVEIGQL